MKLIWNYPTVALRHLRSCYSVEKPSCHAQTLITVKITFQASTIYIQICHQIMWVPQCYLISYFPSFLWSWGSGGGFHRFHVACRWQWQVLSVLPSWLPGLLVFLEDAETGRRPAKLFNVNAHCTVAGTMAGRSVTSRDNARVVGTA